MKNTSITHLSNCAEIFNGKTPSKSEQRDRGRPVLKIRDVDENGVFRENFESFVDDSFYARFKNKQIKIGDTLILNAAHNADYVGSKSFYAIDKVEGVVATGEWLIVRPDQKCLDARYATFWLTSMETRRAMREIVKGIHLYPKDVARLEIQLPPLDEQKRIATILDQADALRRLRQCAIDRLNAFTQSIFNNMFEGVNGERQKNMCSLNELANIQIGYPFKSAHYIEDGSGMRLCRGANVMPGRINWDDLAQYPSGLAEKLMEYNLDVDDIVIAMDRPWISSGFKIAQICKGDTPSLLVQRVARLRAKTPEDASFLYFLLRSNAFRKHCKTTETTVPHISPIDIKSFSFSCPPRKERERFNEICQSFNAVKNEKQKESGMLDSLFFALQHRAFRGEL